MAYIPYPHTVTIASGQTTSDALQLNAATILTVALPAAFTGTGVTFLGSFDGATYFAVVDTAGADIGATGLAAGDSFPVDPVVFLGYRYVKVVSNAAEGGARVVTLSCRIVE